MTIEQQPVIEQKNKKGQSPTVYQEFERLGDGDNITMRCRLLKYNSPMVRVKIPVMVDIREWLKDHVNEDGSMYTGFTKRGVSLTEEDIIKLLHILPVALEMLTKIKARGR